GFKYRSLHYQYYNRFSEDGTGAPAGAHPFSIYRTGTLKVNHSQRIPRPLEDIQDDPIRHALIGEVFADLMELIHDNIAHHLPDIYSELCVYVDHLPQAAYSPVYPFGGFVINVSACTRAYCGNKDDTICVVAAFGDWEGGELCLYEPGLVFKMRPGDILIFPSGRLTHFNLHFTGMRGSLVLSTDRSSRQWVQNRNGWGAHLHTGVAE
ncbi:hypothetical protein BV25DRAFT_1811966, partial [Artomyces pyxidatus]